MNRWRVAAAVIAIYMVAMVSYLSVDAAFGAERPARTMSRLCTAPIISGHKCVSPNCSRWYLCFDMRHRTPSGPPGVLPSRLQPTTEETRG